MSNNLSLDFWFVSSMLMLGVMLVLIIFLLIMNIQDSNLCNLECKDAIGYEPHSNTKFGGLLTGERELLCICYYQDGIKSKKVLVNDPLTYLR